MKPKSTLRSFLAIAGSSLLTITYASAGTYYWDANGDGNPYFGSAGTNNWVGAPGTGNLWSTDPVGSAGAVADYPTTTADELNFGVLGAVSLTGAATTSGSAIVTCDSTAGLVVGDRVTGTGIPNTSNYTVASITDGTTFVMSGNATATNTGLTLGTSHTCGIVTIVGTVDAGYLRVASGNHIWAYSGTPIINFSAEGTFESNEPNTLSFPFASITGAVTSMKWKVGYADNLSIQAFDGVTITNGAARNIITGPGRITSNNTLNFGALGTPLTLDGGTIRMNNGILWTNYDDMHADHPLTFTPGAKLGIENSRSTIPFTVFRTTDPTFAVVGAGGIETEGQEVILNQNYAWTGPLNISGGRCSIELPAHIGTGNNLVFTGGTLKIRGTTIPDFATIVAAGHPVIFTLDKTVGIEIVEALHTFTVDQTLNQGTGGFTKSGAGTVNLNHTTTSSTYTGTTTVSAGTLNVSNIPAAVSGLTSVSGTGTLNLSTDNSAATGGVTLTAGTLNVNHAAALGTGMCTLTGGTLKNTVTTLSTTHPVTFGGNFTWDGVNNLTFGSGAITIAASRNLTLNGTGSTLTFGGVLTNTNAGNPTLAVIGAGNTLVIGGGYKLSNTPTSRTPVINNTGNVTINGALTNGDFLATACGFTYSGAGTCTLAGNNTHGGLTTLNNATTGTLTLAGDNSGAAGGVLLTTGTLNINSNTALGTGTTTLTAGIFNNTSGSPKTTTGTTAIVLNGNTTYSGTNNLTLGGPVQLNNSRTITLNGASTLTLANLVNTQAGDPGLTVTAGTGNNLVIGGLDLSNTATLRTVTVQGTANTTVTGAVRGSSFVGSETIASPLTKSGTGTLTLQGTNIYTGNTTVNTGGCLALIGGSQSSAITVNSGAFLGFTLGSPTTSSAALNLQTGHAIRITGTPTLASYTLITAASIGGTGTPTLETPIPGYELAVEGGNTLVLKTSSTPFQDWALLKGLTGNPGFENGKTDDPDGDGKNNNFEFAFNGNPLSGSDNGMMAGLVQDASLPAGNEMTLVVAVRNGATFANAGTPVVQTATVDEVTYTIEGTLDLVTIPGSDVSQAAGPSNTAPSGSGLTADLTSAGWKYHTFKLDASEGLGSKGFLRAKAE